jgi:hypothetical protein
MRSLLLLLCLTSFDAFARLEKLTIQNLDLEYALPYGKGTVDRVGIGISLAPQSFEVEVHRLNDSFAVTSPYLDFSWINPMSFFHDLEEISAKKTNANLGSLKVHNLESEYLMFRPKERGQYKVTDVRGNCEGEATGLFEIRLMEDCRTKMDLTIKKIDIPTDFILYKIAQDLPEVETVEADIPGSNVIFSSRNGDFALQIYVKFWIRAGIRAWGHVQYENNYKTIAIRVDQIKYGILPVTNLVMKKLKEVIKSPNVTVDPPWIRINLEGNDEVPVE